MGELHAIHLDAAGDARDHARRTLHNFAAHPEQARLPQRHEAEVVRALIVLVAARAVGLSGVLLDEGRNLSVNNTAGESCAPWCSCRVRIASEKE